MKKNSKTLYLYSPFVQKGAVSSGDKSLFSLFEKLFHEQGFNVIKPSDFNSKDSKGCSTFQHAKIKEANTEIERLINRMPKPDYIVTYHHYYRAPDLIGPALARHWGCSYLIIEASLSSKQAHGPWSLYHTKTIEALNQATSLITINPADLDGLSKNYAQKIKSLKPFLEPLPDVIKTREQLAQEHKLDPGKIWLLVVAQMRKRHKLPSYLALAEILKKLGLPYELIIIGDGLARPEIEKAFKGLPAHFLGEVQKPDLYAYYKASDILPWPGIGEAIGMCYTEAQAFGCVPVMFAESGGRYVVHNEETAFVAEDPCLFLEKLNLLITSGDLRAVMSEKARLHIQSQHSFETVLDALLF